MNADASDFSWLQPLTTYFDQAVAADRLGHAPLLTGPPGVGKSWLADWLALRLLCLEPVDGQACGRCRSCQLLPNGTHPDFFRLQVEEDKSAILVNQVRVLIDRLMLTPSIGSRRVGLIQPADRMNINAANALLKTLEEPAPETWLILISDRPQQLPATILSRCQRFSVPLPKSAEALAWLESVCADTDPDSRELALSLADGSPQTAAAWLNEGELDFGLSVRDQLQAMLAGTGSAASFIEHWQENPQRSWRWLARWTQAWTRQALTGSATGLEDSRPVSSGSSIADAHRVEGLHFCWQQALEGARLAEKPVRHDWLLQSWLQQWQKLSDGRGS